MTTEKTELLAELSTRTVYLMGGSFMLGCLFTILLLLALDMVRQSQMQQKDDVDAQE